MKAYVRRLAQRPGLAGIVIATLALGIGANTAIYSVAKAVVFTPLPFREPDAVVHIFEGGLRDRYQPGDENSLISVRGGTFQDWQQQARSFDRIAAVRLKQAMFTGTDRGVAIDGVLAGEGLFELLGVPPLLGRYFSMGDYANDGHVVVLSHKLWIERYNGDIAIVGRNISIDNASYRVIGVMPKGFYPARWYEPQFWLPLQWVPATKYSRVLWGLIVYGRLKPGVTLDQAQADLDLVSSRLRAQYPADYDKMRAVVAPAAGYTFGHHERLFLLLLGAVVLVLLIGATNIANLLLARALEREREFSIRAALGASHGTLLREALAESLILAGIGGLLGITLSPLLTRPILALLPPSSQIPRVADVHIDLGVLAFTIFISISVGVLFGLVPGLRAAGASAALALREGGRGNSLSRQGRRLSDLLVVSEVGLSLVLLAGGALLMQTFLRLLHTDPGFRPEHALAFEVIVPVHHYGTYEIGGRNASRERLFRELVTRSSVVPGVQIAAAMANLPLRHGPNPWAISVEGRDSDSRRDSGSAASGTRLPYHGSVSTQRVTPGYFAAFGIPLRRGRLFDEHDRPDSPMVAVINETAAQKYFPGEDPIGKRITIDMTSYFPRMTIVGIVGDSKLNALDREVYPQVFWPMAFLPGSNAWLVVRTSAEPKAVATEVRRAIQGVDSDLAIREVAPMSEIVQESLWPQRLSALLIGLLAVLATLVTLGGLYSVISYSVARRTKELGIRIAVGATWRDIAVTVLMYGLRIVGAGVLLGVTATLVLNRIMAGKLAAPAADSPWMLPMIAAGFTLLTVMACLPPLRRALSVDPLTVLRAE
jgi:putative ABC transport system permease protein